MYDVVIVGGGTGGVASAVSYAKAGFKVAIIEKQLSLGGTQTNGLVTPFMPSQVSKSNISKLILDNYQKYDKDTGKIEFEQAYSFNPELFQYSLDRLMDDLGVDVYYDMVCISAEVSGQTIVSVTAQNAFTTMKFEAGLFVDASANVQLGKLAGLSIQADDSVKQAVSLRFEIANIDLTRLKAFLVEKDYKFGNLEKPYLEFVYVPENELVIGLKPYVEQAIKDGIITSDDARYIQGFTTPSTDGLLSFNGPQLPNVYDIFNPLEYSKAISQGRHMQQRLHKFLKLYIPGFEQSFISKSANMLGVRESSRLLGVQTATGDDYLNRRKDTTSVAKGDWYIDIHSDDIEVESDSFKMKYNAGEYYDIPYGTLVSTQADNYISIGRHISTSFEMQASTRIQYTIYMMAEELGKIYQYCQANEVKVNDVKSIKKGYYESK